MPESQKAEAELSGTDVAVSKEARAEETLKAPGRRLSESRMRENLMSGSRWQGMETRIWCRLMRHSFGNGEQTDMLSLSPRRHSLTLPL
jgi:hypothetical protein